LVLEKKAAYLAKDKYAHVCFFVFFPFTLFCKSKAEEKNGKHFVAHARMLKQDTKKIEERKGGK